MLGKNIVDLDAHRQKVSDAVTKKEEAQAKQAVAAAARLVAKEKAKEEARLAKERAKAEREEARRARAVAEEECRIETEKFRQRLAEEKEREANTHEMPAVDGERVKAADDAD